MKKTLLLLFCFLTINIFGQSEVMIYDAEGNYVTTTAYINTVSKEYFNNEDVYQHSVFKDGIFTIAFKKFTDKVVFISLTGDAKDKDIRKAIESFSLHDYFNSLSFRADLRSKIKDKNFTDMEALRSFGKPYRSTENTETKIYYYNFPNLTLIFRNGILQDYIINK